MKWLFLFVAAGTLTGGVIMIFAAAPTLIQLRYSPAPFSGFLERAEHGFVLLLIGYVSLFFAAVVARLDRIASAADGK